MMSTGFQWGTMKIVDRNTSSLQAKMDGMNETSTAVPRYTPMLKPSSSGKKRKFQEEEGKVHKPTNPNNRKHHFNNNNRFKKSRTPNILGQKLPISRLIEVLDKKSLQSLLQNLIQVRPEINDTIAKLSPKPTITNSISLLREKFDDISGHLPYKCDIESDYSYLRVKPYLNEFLSCLSDFILHYLPPVETEILTSLTFLDLVTDLIRGLPNFTNSEFQYTKSIAYDQIANTWMIALNQNILYDEEHSGNSDASTFEVENSIKLLKIIDELSLEEKLSRYNESSMGKFKVILDFIKSQREILESINHTLNNNSSALSDLISVDYSNFSITARSSH